VRERGGERDLSQIKKDGRQKETLRETEKTERQRGESSLSQREQRQII